MILRRFMQHFSDQNWFAVGLDVIVVVVGIFLGMQVTEWNENRKEAETSGFIHQKLVADFTTIQDQDHCYTTWRTTEKYPQHRRRAAVCVNETNAEIDQER